MAKHSGGLFRDLNHFVFWPPFILVVAAVVLNVLDKDRFTQTINGANTWVIANFGWLFTTCAFLAVLLCVYICFSSFANLRIGGAGAKPLMSMWNWFAITVCTTIAIGILFWSTVEPIMHYTSPPSSLGIEASSPAAAKFAMSTLYVHWSFTPYAMYCVASLMFAFAYYNMKKPFSLGSTLAPLLGDYATTKAAGLVDSVCLYSLVLGMAAALGAGILTISGGLTFLFDVPPNKWVWLAITASIVGTFIVSSATGLMNGIRILSDINARALFLLAILILVMGPTVFILSFGLESLGIYLTTFFERNLFTGALDSDNWSADWTVFYWAVWLAWAPITACFLGRIAYGRTVREFMIINFILPSLFGIAWMAIFGGTALHQHMNGVVDLLAVIQDPEKGNQMVSYVVFSQFPGGILIIAFYMFSAFVCFVTSSDSNTTAMAAISSTGISPENPEGNIWLKIIWGATVGIVAWVMISFANVNGIRILSTLGGFPAAILVLLIIVSLTLCVANPEKYNQVDASSSKIEL